MFTGSDPPLLITVTGAEITFITQFKRLDSSELKNSPLLSWEDLCHTQGKTPPLTPEEFFHLSTTLGCNPLLSVERACCYFLYSGVYAKMIHDLFSTIKSSRA